jgi:hypothetical protein
MAYQNRGPERRCSLGIAVWTVEQFSKQRQAGPTPPLQRTLELFSSSGGLQGTAASFSEMGLHKAPLNGRARI